MPIFVRAQGADNHFETALIEIGERRKRSHWMWFVFPQLRGLGAGPMAHRYGISSLDEARADLAHRVLGDRLVTATRRLLDGKAASMTVTFGELDSMKLRSSMTLFSEAAPNEHVFREVIDRYYGGVPDGLTKRLLFRLTEDKKPAEP